MLIIGIEISLFSFIYAVVVFNLNTPGNISKAIKGERAGTLIGDTWSAAKEGIQENISY